MTERVAFGLELQRTRERRSLSLDQLADCTKISASLFAGLERGDISRWPSGIFRRAFVRSYAQAVGLDPEATVGRFLRLYPDGEEEAAAPSAPAQPVDAAEEKTEPRLILDAVQAPAEKPGGVVRRVAAPVVDILLAAVPALAVSALLGREWFWVAAAAVGLLGHLLVFSIAGVTPGAWLFRQRPAPLPVVTEGALQARRRPEAEAPSATVPASRRRQPRHASASRGVSAARTRRVQH